MSTKADRNVLAFCDGVLTGHYDKHLDMVQAEIANRRRALSDARARRNKLELTEGTRVRTVASTRPRYMASITGTVVPRPPNYQARLDTIYVDIGRRIRKYGPVVGMPASLLEKI